MFKFALLFAITAPLAHAQVVDLAKDRLPITELHGLVRFHTGDDPNGKLGWADPGFNDSNWPLIHVDQPWTAQGFQSESGFAWYRFQMVVPPDHSQLALYEPVSDICYEIYFEGHRIAQYGSLPPNWSFPQSSLYVPPVHRIPDELIPVGRPAEVALRVWQWPYWTYTPPGLISPPIVGDAQLLKEQRELRISDNLRTASGDTFLTVACLLGFCAGLGLFLLRPAESEYLWFAFAELGMAGMAGLNSYIAAHTTEFHLYGVWRSQAYLVHDICWATFLVTFLKEPRRRLYWASILLSIAICLAWVPSLFQWISTSAFIVLIYLLVIPREFTFALLVWNPARRGDFDARLLLAPQLLYVGATAAQGVIFLLFATTRYFALAVLWQDRYDHLLKWPFTFSVASLVDFLTQAAVLAIIVLRFARKSRDEERYKNEREAARTVQQVLVPAESPSVPGFAIESVYRPANEVGGDFFQIAPMTEGGALIVVGDVSGKGMPAAMTVSLLVGTFRTLAQYTHSPSEILHAMNQRMIGRNSGGFTTCIVLRVDPDGQIAAANAGHIPPYIDGREVPMENGLPLGLSAASAYSESTLCLPTAAQLTLITDGVLEAQSPTGELFGFDRTAAISNQPAEEIAAAAQAFGQEDDITVLTLTFAPAVLSPA